MGKTWKQTLAILLCTTCGISFSTQLTIEAKDETNPAVNEYSETNKDLGIPIGSVIYDIDQNGNMSERIVTGDDAVTLEEAEKEYYMNFYGNGEVVAEDPYPYKVYKLDENTGEETLVLGEDNKSFEYANLAEAEVAYTDKISKEPLGNYAIKTQDTYLKIKYAILKFKKIKNNDGYITNIKYKEDITNVEGYTNPGYAIEAVVLDQKNDEIKFKMGGVIGWVNASKVEIEPYKEKVNYISYYKMDQGKLVHKIKSTDITEAKNYSSSINVGPAPEYIKKDTVYYSFDGHYFYTDYFRMVDDIRLGVTANAVNKDQPYYNYYQFLPMHSQSNYSEDDLNRFIKEYRGYTEKPTSNNYADLKPTQSLLVDEGHAFIKAEVNGVNPVMAMGVAINESAWGRSKISITKNNLFGLNAVDSNPSGAADVFESAAACIEKFGKQWVTWGYLDIQDFRYFGGHLGDKASGMNVKYASDPFWGEKAASHSYTIDDFLGKKDYQQYALGIKETYDDLTIRKKPDTKSEVIYLLKSNYYKAQISKMPVILLSEHDGSDVNGNKKWYKIYTDHVLDASQNMIKFNKDDLTTTFNTPYNFEHSQGYVSSAYIRKFNEGRGLPVVPEPKPDPIPEPEPTIDIQTFLSKTGLTVENEYLLGITEKKQLSELLTQYNAIDTSAQVVMLAADGTQVTEGYVSTGMKLVITIGANKYEYTFVIKGDVNGKDGITPADYVFVRNYLNNKISLNPAQIKAADVNRKDGITPADYVMVRNHLVGKISIQ